MNCIKGTRAILENLGIEKEQVDLLVVCMYAHFGDRDAWN
jgi:hypothetical protein